MKIKDFILKQHCIPWRVANLLNYSCHSAYMLLRYGRININTRKYWENRWSGTDNRLNESIISLFNQVAKKIPQTSTVLDVGCGDGSFMQLLRDEYDIASFGIDFSASAIFSLKNKGLKGAVALATKIPFSDNTFDVVTTIEVLEHLDIQDCEKTLEEMSRVSKASGFILITVPSLDGLIPQVEDEHVRAYGIEDLNNFLIKFLKNLKIEASEDGRYLIACGQAKKLF